MTFVTFNGPAHAKVERTKNGATHQSDFIMGKVADGLLKV
jgi:hypothetical protein